MVRASWRPAVAPAKVFLCRVLLPWSRVRVSFSRGTTSGTLHSMVKDPPRFTQVGCSFSSTSFGGSAGEKVGRSGQDGGAIPADPPSQDYPLLPVFSGLWLNLWKKK